MADLNHALEFVAPPITYYGDVPHVRNWRNAPSPPSTGIFDVDESVRKTRMFWLGHNMRRGWLGAVQGETPRRLERFTCPDLQEARLIAKKGWLQTCAEREGEKSPDVECVREVRRRGAEVAGFM